MTAHGMAWDSCDSLFVTPIRVYARAGERFYVQTITTIPTTRFLR